MYIAQSKCIASIIFIQCIIPGQILLFAIVLTHYRCTEVYSSPLSFSYINDLTTVHNVQSQNIAIMVDLLYRHIHEYTFIAGNPHRCNGVWYLCTMRHSRDGFYCINCSDTMYMYARLSQILVTGVISQA